MPVTVISDVLNTRPCVFCKSPQIDEVNLGPIYAYEDVACHYYCLLFSAALSQGGTDDQGILGFLPLSIWKEVRRASRLRCSYCQSSGASVGCCKKSCKHAFHFPCGLKFGANFEFLGEYQVFCTDHKMVRNVHLKIKYKDWKCPICMTRVTKADEPMMANCCKGAVFHKTCVKKMALNAGYFFKCPMCNATKVFVQAMREQGIFVPEQDASWETEPNAYQDLYYQYSRCDAKVCECTKGREYGAAKGGFLLARCRLCGATGTHRQCGKLKTIANWACEDCSVAEQEAERKKKLKIANLQSMSYDSAKPSSSKNIGSQRTNSRNISSAKKPVKMVKSKDAVPFPVRGMPHGDVETVDLSKVRVSPWCFAYFPHNDGQLKKFQKQKRTLIPDWRGLGITCNLVNWLGNQMQKSKEQVKVAKPRSIPVGVTKPKKKKRSTRWGRGVVKKRKGAAKNTVKPSLAKNQESSEPIPSTSQQALSQLRMTVKSDNEIKDLRTEKPESIVSEHEEKKISPKRSPENYFKVPNPLKKLKVVDKKQTNSNPQLGSDLFVQGTLELCSDEKPLVDIEIDYAALHPIQPYDEIEDYVILDSSALELLESNNQVSEVVITDVVLEDSCVDNSESGSLKPSDTDEVLNVINQDGVDGGFWTEHSYAFRLEESLVILQLLDHESFERVFPEKADIEENIDPDHSENPGHVSASTVDSKCEKESMDTENGEKDCYSEHPENEPLIDTPNEKNVPETNNVKTESVKEDTNNVKMSINTQPIIHEMDIDGIGIKKDIDCGQKTISESTQASSG